jgi:hypothetical protein
MARTHLVSIKLLEPKEFRGVRINTRLWATRLDGRSDPVAADLDLARPRLEQEAVLAHVACTECEHQHEVIDGHTTGDDTLYVVSCNQEKGTLKKTHLVCVQFVGPAELRWGVRIKATWLGGVGDPMIELKDYSQPTQEAMLALAACSACPRRRRHEILDYHTMVMTADTFYVIKCS